ncbi:YdcF family protein [Gordonia terrae]|uniref:YdcF family protein n=3 Tax=Gordonia terrae TaxID=2055 RepID=A0AAD0NZC0_9ACTN|nr:YdcF family protein [Gordonia terrae]GAB45568.1 hypothetical protein GOTRE_125_02060 [Gordonia terrae NBRC 100016]
MHADRARTSCPDLRDSCDTIKFVMGVLIVAAVLLIASAVLAWQDPRRLSPGILLTAGLSGVMLAAVIVAVDRGIDDDGSVLAPAVVIVALGLVALLATLILGASLIANGVTLLRREGRRPANLLSALLGSLLSGYALAVLLGIIVGWFDVSTSNALLNFLLAVGIPAGYLGFVFASLLLWSWLYGRWSKWRARRAKVGAIIVLGAGLLDGSRVGPLLASRLDRGREIYDLARASGLDPLIICSGGRGGDERLSEAAAMAEYLVSKGVDRDAIALEDRSTDTAENLRYSRRVLDERGVTEPVAVVTSGYHAFRGAMLMRSAGIDGFSTGAHTARYFVPNAQVRKFLAVLRDHGWINSVVLVLLSVPLISGTAVALFG